MGTNLPQTLNHNLSGITDRESSARAGPSVIPSMTNDSSVDSNILGKRDREENDCENFQDGSRDRRNRYAIEAANSSVPFNDWSAAEDHFFNSDDDHATLDLTGETPSELIPDSSQNEASWGSSNEREELRRYVEASGMSQDELAQLGIDWRELKEQFRATQHFEQTKNDYDYARSLQSMIDGNLSPPNVASSSSPAGSIIFALPETSSLPNTRSDLANNFQNSPQHTLPNHHMPSSAAHAGNGLLGLPAIRPHPPTINPVNNNDPLNDEDVIDLTNDQDDSDLPVFLVDDDSDGNLSSDDTHNDLETLMRGEGLGPIWNPDIGLFANLMQPRHIAIAPRHNLAFERRLPPITALTSHPPPTPSTSRQATTAHTTDELRALLQNVQNDESHNESRIDTPAGLIPELLEHQKVGVKWMINAEEGSNKGGILADDMGLGKTIQALAIILSRPCIDATPISNIPNFQRKPKSSQDIPIIKTKATLVVCPVALIGQWEREIRSKTMPKLSVMTHHGTGRTSDERLFTQYDVVITAYTTLASDFGDDIRDQGPLSRILFHRVILDEAHMIKNRRTRMAQATCRVKSVYRWCLSATPIQNKIEELYSLIKFLDIRPYNDWARFNLEINKPLRSGRQRDAMQRVQVLLKAVCLRRSKKATIDGKPILTLPERNVHMTYVDFSAEERRFYDHVNRQAQDRFNKYANDGSVMKNYSSVLVLLLRLRQACLHPRLTMSDGPEEGNGLNTDRQKEMATRMDPTVVRRLLNQNDLKEIECPICMDMADQAQIIARCGHVLCRECHLNYMNTNSSSEKRCPHCRGPMTIDSVIPVEIFFQVYAPEIYEELTGGTEGSEEQEEIVPVKDRDTSAKLDKMVEILEETRATASDDKTIIFSQFTSMLDLIEIPLKSHGYKFARYDGSMSVAKRDAVLKSFHDDPSVSILIVSTKCGSLGLNLTCANRVIVMDVWWNPALENQAIDRVHRIGQTKDVHVHRIFVSNTVEDRILELQKQKQSLTDGAFGEGIGQSVGRLGLEELMYLFRGGQVPHLAPIRNRDPGVGPSSRVYAFT